MNVLLLLASLIVGSSYHSEDFHWYNESLQAQGLPLVNKVFVDGNKLKDKKEFLKTLEGLKTLDRFKEFQTNDISGILLFFNNKKDTLEALNQLAEKYPVYPVVIYDGIECTTTGEIIVRVHPSVNKDDFMQRLNKVADGKFRTVEDINTPKTFSIVVDELRNPSNVLILANLIAKDRFWAVWATVYWIPLDGYVKANATVETPSVSHLGELRNFKVTIDIMNPDVKIRTDLLPQLGQGLLPFPFAGEVWFDPQPPKISEVKTSRGKQVTVDYLFRQLQYGDFMIQPIVISYEKNGELLTTRTNMCRYAIRSVIEGTNIDDIQPRGDDGLDLVVLRPVGFPRTEDPMKSVWRNMKVLISSLCFGIAAIFLFGAIVAMRKNATNWFRSDENEQLWKGLLWCRAVPPKLYYLTVSQYLNRLLTNLYGVSLYSVNRNEATTNFKNLVKELDKLYQSDADYNFSILNGLVNQFCKDRRYK